MQFPRDYLLLVTLSFSLRQHVALHALTVIRLSGKTMKQIIIYTQVRISTRYFIPQVAAFSALSWLIKLGSLWRWLYLR